MPAPDPAPALLLRLFQPPPALVGRFVGPDGRIETMLAQRPTADSVPVVLGPRGRRGEVSAAQLAAEPILQAAERHGADIEIENRLGAAETALGADPGDLTLLFENGLI